MSQPKPRGIHYRNNLLRLTLLNLAFALIATACAGSTEIDLGIPDFTILPYQGDVLGQEEIQLSAVLERTGKPLVLNFWASLCPPCRAEMPDFQEVYETRSDEVMILGVDIGPFQLLGTRAEGMALLSELGLTYPAGTTFNAQVVREYQILGMPTTYFVTKNGALKQRFSGLLTKEKMNEFIDEIVADSL